MKKQEIRRARLLEMLSERKRTDIGTVVKELQISEATARRLFTDLENEGKLIRVHGGIQASPEMAFDYSFRLSASSRIEEKKAIGAAAANHVCSGDRIYLDSGTTLLKMTDALVSRLKLNEISNISVVTNSLSMLDNLANVVKTTLIGGVIRPSRRDVSGILAVKNLSMYHFDKAFLGVDSISTDGELMTTDDSTAAMNETVIRNSRKIFILADSSKFGGRSFVSYARLADIGATVISDDRAGKKFLSGLRSKNITTEIASSAILR